MGRASIADEGVEPPRDFQVSTKSTCNKAKWNVDGRQKRRLFPFYITRDSLKGNWYNGNELIERFLFGKPRPSRELLRFHWDSYLYYGDGIHGNQESITGFGNFIPEA